MVIGVLGVVGLYYDIFVWIIGGKVCGRYSIGWEGFGDYIMMYLII